MRKVTLSVDEDLYNKINKHKDQLNLSQIFRKAIEGEILKAEFEEAEKKGEEDYLILKGGPRARAALSIYARKGRPALIDSILHENLDLIDKTIKKSVDLRWVAGWVDGFIGEHEVDKKKKR